jgi:hypothetical protein
MSLRMRRATKTQYAFNAEQCQAYVHTLPWKDHFLTPAKQAECLPCERAHMPSVICVTGDVRKSLHAFACICFLCSLNEEYFEKLLAVVTR